MKIELIEQFKAAFTDSLVYADLATEYTSYEIFEVNNGKFELEAVQQAYKNWSKQNAVDVKRAHFAKDLDKLVSGDYVLVPKKPTMEMIVSGLAVIATAIGQKNIQMEVEMLWQKMAETAQEQV